MDGDNGVADVMTMVTIIDSGVVFHSLCNCDDVVGATDRDGDVVCYECGARFVSDGNHPFASMGNIGLAVQWGMQRLMRVSGLAPERTASLATAMGIGDGSLHVPGPMEADDKHKAQSAAQAPSMETNMTRAEQAAIEKRYGKPLDEIEPEIMRSLGYRWTGTNGWQKQPRRHSRDLARRIRRDARRASRYRGQPGGGPREDVNIRHATHEMLAAIKAEDIRRHFGGMSRIYASYIGGYDRR